MNCTKKQEKSEVVNENVFWRIFGKLELAPMVIFWFQCYQKQLKSKRTIKNTTCRQEKVNTENMK